MKIFLKDWVKTQDFYSNFTKNLRERKQMYLSQLIRILYIYTHTQCYTLHAHVHTLSNWRSSGVHQVVLDSTAKVGKKYIVYELKIIEMVKGLLEDEKESYACGPRTWFSGSQTNRTQFCIFFFRSL